MNSSRFNALGIAVLQTEAEAIQALIERMDSSFQQACEMMLRCEGRIVVTGMGKSGHIGNKVAATLASTGTPAFFMHPGEASHGDLGMITEKDLLLAFSNSGETAEITTLLPLIKRLKVDLIALTGQPGSTLAELADVHINVAVEKEACPLGLAPTSSTTASLAMGDALAIALLEARGFTEQDFARSHPGGSLGRRLLLRVRDVMHSGERIPLVSEQATVKQALLEISKKGLGMTIVLDNNEKLAGIFTDGDLRRTLDDKNFHLDHPIALYMTANCVTISADEIASAALTLMDENQINGLVVTDSEGSVQGALNMHDLLTAGIV